MIEISNDRILTKEMEDEGKKAYMECLMNVAVKIRRQEIPLEVSFNKSSVRELKQRIVLIQENAEEQNFFRKSLFFGTLLLLWLSFFIILEPYTEAPEGAPMTAENTYLIQNGEMYDVYVDGEFFFSTDDLTPFQGVAIKKEEDKDE